MLGNGVDSEAGGLSGSGSAAHQPQLSSQVASAARPGQSPRWPVACASLRFRGRGRRRRHRSMALTAAGREVNSTSSRVGPGTNKNNFETT
eukprot:219604-Rhodomonas_salina.1